LVRERHGIEESFFFSSRRRHTRWPRDWSSDVCSSDLVDIVNTRGSRRISSPSAESSAAVKLSLVTGRPPCSEERRRRPAPPPGRSEERRVGKEGRSRWAQDQ